MPPFATRPHFAKRAALSSRLHAAPATGRDRRRHATRPSAAPSRLLSTRWRSRALRATLHEAAAAARRTWPTCAIAGSLCSRRREVATRRNRRAERRQRRRGQCGCFCCCQIRPHWAEVAQVGAQFDQSQPEVGNIWQSLRSCPTRYALSRKPEAISLYPCASSLKPSAIRLKPWTFTRISHDAATKKRERPRRGALL